MFLYKLDPAKVWDMKSFSFLLVSVGKRADVLPFFFFLHTSVELCSAATYLLVFPFRLLSVCCLLSAAAVCLLYLSSVFVTSEPRLFAYVGEDALLLVFGW